MGDEVNPRDNPKFQEIKNLDDHDLLIVLHTQMLNIKSEVQDMKKGFASKWVEKFNITVIMLIVTGVVGTLVTVATSAIQKAIALGGH